VGKKPRKKQTANTPRRERIPVKDIQLPQDGSYDTAKEAIALRMSANLASTGHPLHHQTADGTIVEPDPTLEMLMTHVSPDEMPPIPAARPDAWPAVPVVRDCYEREPGRTWLLRWLAAQSK
jgi:hypothetical protein